jgi:hypothetical protein
MRRRGPLAGSYAAAVALVICALVPFLTLRDRAQNDPRPRGEIQA